MATSVCASAQTLGTFSWQQQPYCNVVTVTVVQAGAIYQLDGTDDQCGAARKASVTGLAFPNPDGTIGMGLTLVTNSAGATDGSPLHIDATVTLATVNEGGYFEGGKGLYARGTDNPGEAGYGARIYSDQYRGMYVQGGANWFDAYFGGNAGISAFGITDRSNFRSLAVNLGDSDIAPGDLVAVAGVASSVECGQPILGVAKLSASNRHAVVGVAVSAFGVGTVAHGHGRSDVDFSPIPGLTPKAGYLSIMTSGLAPTVNLDSLAVAMDGGDAGLRAAAVGDKVALAISGTPPSTGGVSLGRVAAPANSATGTIALFLQIT